MKLKAPNTFSGEHHTDQELIERYKESGSNQVLATLFNRYAHKVLGLGISILKNVQDAEDASMEVFELLCKKLDLYEIKNFESWLFYVARNHFLRQLHNKLQLHPEDISEINPDFFMEIGEEDTPYSEELLENLSDAIDDLKEGQRHCVILFYLEQKSYKEIADLTDYDLNQVKSYIQNGRRNLKNALIKAL